MLDDGEAPARPTWQNAFLAGVPQTLTALEPGLFCRDIAARGGSFTTAALYWISEGAPERMDADRNGIPCETVYPSDEIEALLEEGKVFDGGLRCSALNLPDDPTGYRRAVAYWMLEGLPDRMDADGNGIPCETLFSADTIGAALDTSTMAGR
jgi:hypothetical protein